MASVPMVIVIELLRDTLKSMKESLCSFQKMICDRCIKKQKIEKFILEIISLSYICIEDLELKAMPSVWNVDLRIQMELKGINL